jgi:hypothetical protein
MATETPNTTWTSFMSDKPNTAWWVWAGNSAPELWMTRARPFWTRVLAAIGRAPTGGQPVVIRQADIAALHQKLTQAGVRPKFQSNTQVIDAEVLRAAAWYAFHRPNASLDDVWFPRNPEDTEVVQAPMLDVALIGDSDVTARPVSRQLGQTGDDAAVRKSVGLEVTPPVPDAGTPGPAGGGAQTPATPQPGKTSGLVVVAVVAVVAGLAWWGLSNSAEKDDGGDDD